MITCVLQGGLGNQMFQIAATYALSREVGSDYFLNFNNCNTPAQGYTSNKYKDSIFKDIKNMGFKVTTSSHIIYNEPKFSYNPIPPRKNTLLNGYFQSEKYFIKYKKQIKKLFKYDEENHDKIQLYLGEEISENDIITAIHVRRGDYLKNPTYHPTLSVDYYKKAMDEIGEGRFLFISDDINWCKENFKGDNIHYSQFTSEIDDLTLISLCDNQIISNSSFSWWGAYLCPWDDNKVIAPSIWFGPSGPQDTDDIYLKNWIIF